jgi:hypothetical protein
MVHSYGDFEDDNPENNNSLRVETFYEAIMKAQDHHLRVKRAPGDPTGATQSATGMSTF